MLERRGLILGILIASNRLGWIPKEFRLAHEYCFFLHDEVARMLVEYEAADASTVSFKFESREQGRRFRKLAKKHDTLAAMRELGLHSEARRVILNQITAAMTSDCAHHIFESLRCFEKRKFVPGFNLLRKPLLDSLMYLSWMVADEDGFYSAFAAGDPTKLTQKLLGNRRREILSSAIAKIGLSDLVSAEELISVVFDAGNPYGLYGFFQHAVHLITVERIEIRTSPENFNFIFKDPSDDGLYETLYMALPTALLYLSHVIMALHERVAAPDEGAKAAFSFRTTNMYRCLHQKGYAEAFSELMGEILSPRITCPSCSSPLKVTMHNVPLLLLAESFRCTRCQRRSAFPLSWAFGQPFSLAESEEVPTIGA
ncbi:hypothetical protein MOQ07_17745 [Stenotrophomonas maltophilia]|nr:hypothetical protein [Stenotrophomonas maltophilia]MCI1088492.1 hypothetical protein [Stenotrophomonas maltophilia]MCI1117713.1 hypothetical protein [Stenotrophomonas maltophilia]